MKIVSLGDSTDFIVRAINENPDQEIVINAHFRKGFGNSPSRRRSAVSEMSWLFSWVIYTRRIMAAHNCKFPYVLFSDSGLEVILAQTPCKQKAWIAA